MSILHARLERDGTPLRENQTKWGVSYDNDMGTHIFATGFLASANQAQDVWPKKYYNSEATSTNPLRCIMNDATWRTQYYTNMSKAFASLCEVFATVMDASIGPGADTPGYVNKGGLWFQAEFPVLQEQNKVLMIEAISPDGQVACTYWTKTNVVHNSIHDTHVYGRGMATGSEAWLDIFSVAHHSLREDRDMNTFGE